MAKTRDYMDYLDENIEIAPANSQEEYQAAQTIAEVMRDHGLETSVEEFEASSMSKIFLHVLILLAIICLVACGLTQGIVHTITLILGLLCMGVVIFSHFGTNLLENIGPTVRSQNVVGIHRASGSKIVKGARPIVIVAHYDTPRENFLWRGAMVRYQSLLRRSSIVCSIALAVCLLFQALAFLPAAARMVVWAIGLVMSLPLILLAVSDIAERFSACTIGANNNKTSVAALLSLVNVVRPQEDRVDGLEPNRPAPRRSSDPVEPPAPQRVTRTVVEEVKGVRHGPEVMRALGILPPSCEVLYEEPKVRVVEDEPEQPPMLPEAFDGEDLAEGDMALYEDEGDRDAESTRARDEEAYDEDVDFDEEDYDDFDELEDTEGHEGDEESDDIEAAADEELEEGLDEDTDEDTDEEESDLDEEDYEDDDVDFDDDSDDYDEDWYDEDEDEDDTSDSAAGGSWFSNALASIRGFFAGFRKGDDIKIERGKDRIARDLDDELDEYEDDYDDSDDGWMEEEYELEDDEETADEEEPEEELPDRELEEQEELEEYVEGDEFLDDDEYEYVDADDLDDDDEYEYIEYIEYVEYEDEDGQADQLVVDDSDYEGYEKYARFDEDENAQPAPLTAPSPVVVNVPNIGFEESDANLSDSEPSFETDVEESPNRSKLSLAALPTIELEEDLMAEEEPEEEFLEEDVYEEEVEYLEEVEYEDEPTYEEEIEYEDEPAYEEEPAYEDEMEPEQLVAFEQEDEDSYDEELEDDEYVEYVEEEEYLEYEDDEDNDGVGEYLEYKYEDDIEEYQEVEANEDYSDEEEEVTEYADDQEYLDEEYDVDEYADDETDEYEDEEYVENQNEYIADDSEGDSEYSESEYSDEYSELYERDSVVDENAYYADEEVEEEELDPYGSASIGTSIGHRLKGMLRKMRGGGQGTFVTEEEEVVEEQPYEEEAYEDSYQDNPYESAAYDEDYQDNPYERPAYEKGYQDNPYESAAYEEDYVEDEYEDNPYEDEVVEETPVTESPYYDARVERGYEQGGGYAEEEPSAEEAYEDDYADDEEYLEEEEEYLEDVEGEDDSEWYDDYSYEDEEYEDDEYEEPYVEEEYEEEEEPEEPAPRQSELPDPNLLHFDREEDPDIVPRDTTGLDTYSDSYDMYPRHEIDNVPRERPEAIDDPTWGTSSYQPARPVMNIARRAALFDLPDPSKAAFDPLASEYDYEDEDDDMDEGRPSNNWKGGAAVRSDLRDDDTDEPLVIDADDLQDAILELGDEYLLGHDIWFVATGASAYDHAGMKAFVDDHRRDFRGSFLINLQSIGAGELTVLTREGYRASRRADRRVVKMLADIARDLHVKLQQAPYDWDETEAATAMRARVRAATIMGMDENGLPAYVHSQDDLPEQTDVRQVSAVVRILSELIRRS